MRPQLILIILSHVFLHRVDSQKECCDQGAMISSTTVCDNNKNVFLKCGKRLLFTSNYFIMKIEGDGPPVLFVSADETERFHTIPDSYFCTGSTGNSTNPQTAVVGCISNKYVYMQKIRYVKNDSWMLRFIVFLNVSSFLLLAITAFLYFYLAMLQDVYGKICFCFIVTWCLWHAKVLHRILIMCYDFENFSENFCLTNLYVEAFILLSAFAWSIILSHHIWKQSRVNNTNNVEVPIWYYILVGYGVPSLIILTCNVHGHIKHYAEEDELGFDCITHSEILSEIYILIPTIVTLISNIFLCIRARSNIVATAAQFEENKSKSRKTHFRLYLNIKLLIISGLPELIFILFVFIIFEWESFGNYHQIINIIAGIIVLITSSEGIGIFLVLVVFRKRIHKRLIRSGMIRWINVNYDWKLIDDAEMDEECMPHEDPEKQNPFTGSSLPRDFL